MAEDLGKKFEEALRKLEEIENLKRDVMVNPSQIKINDKGQLFIDGLGQIDFTKTGFQQFCVWTDLPSSYMMKLLDTKDKTPEHIQEDINTFIVNMERGINRLKQDRELFFRTIRHANNPNKYKVRAVFSDRYKVVDNLPILQQLQNFKEERLETQGFSVSSDFMDIRFTLPDLKTSLGRLPSHEVRYGMTEDIVLPGIHLRNSETGGSKIKGLFIIYRQVCTNGLTRPQHEFTIIDQRHMGEFDLSEITERFGGIAARAKELFNTYVERYKESKDIVVEDPDEVFDFVGSRKNITKKMVETVRENWVQEQRRGNRKFDLINAFTAGARDWERNTSDYTGRLILENVAGDLLFSKAI